MTHQLQPEFDKVTGAVKADFEEAFDAAPSEQATPDPQVAYPCYKSFDEFIDVERLKSLDGYITERIRQHIQAQKDIQFYTGPFRLKDSSPALPGSRMIYLAQSKEPDNYFDLDKTELWQRTPE